MRVEQTKYAIATIVFPLEFAMESGYATENFEESKLWDARSEAEEELSHFDEPAEFQILEVKVSYQF